MLKVKLQISYNLVKPACTDLHNKEMNRTRVSGWLTKGNNHAGSMAEVNEIFKSCFVIMLNNKTLVEFYTNKLSLHHE